MKNTRFLLIIIALSLLHLSCDKNNDNNNKDKIVGTGDVVSKDIVVSSFNSIIIEGVTNVYATIGDIQTVVYKAQQEILDIMTWSVTNQTLTISMDNNDREIETDEEISAEITIPEIESIALNGVGNYSLSGEKQDILVIEINGAGNIYAYNMEVDTCYILITGVGNCEVRVNNLLDVEITGVGNVKYKGSPVVNYIVTGVGSVSDNN